MKQSSQIKSKVLPLYDMIIFLSKTPSQVQAPIIAEKKGTYYQLYHSLGTKDSMLMSMSREILIEYSHKQDWLNTVLL